MHSEFKLNIDGVSNSHSSTHSFLMEELKKLRRKMEIYPFPFCEQECSLISVCTRIQPLECILHLFREANKELAISDCEEKGVKLSWH